MRPITSPINVVTGIGPATDETDSSAINKRNAVLVICTDHSNNIDGEYARTDILHSGIIMDIILIAYKSSGWDFRSNKVTNCPLG